MNVSSSKKFFGYSDSGVSNPWLSATFLNYIFAVKIARYFRQLGVPLILIFTLAVQGLGHSNWCGTLIKMLDTSAVSYVPPVLTFLHFAPTVY
jgi:hypothetical protein